ncbi:hypothetical protein Hanom_Chr07g00589901 [Helianthus anomalus]
MYRTYRWCIGVTKRRKFSIGREKVEWITSVSTAGYGAGVWAWVGGKRPRHHPGWAWVSAWPLGHEFQAGRGALWPS